jgi:hypothetical protein
MKRVLALVDLENVLSAWCTPRTNDFRVPGERHEGVRIGERPARPQAVRAGEGACSVTVVFAFNDTTPHLFDVTFQNLDAFARRLAVKLGGELTSTEIALVRTIPQAADVALIRLLARSPKTGTGERFESVALLSKDEGLRRRFDAAFPYDYIDPLGVGRFERSAGLMCKRWTKIAGARWYRRASDDAPIPLEAVSPGTAWGNRVLDSAHVAALRGRRVDLQTPVDVAELAGIVKGNNGNIARPSILTQVAVTRSSVRGAGRSVLDLLTIPKLEGVGPDDGVEVSTPNARVEIQYRNQLIVALEPVRPRIDRGSGRRCPSSIV